MIGEERTFKEVMQLRQEACILVRGRDKLVITGIMRKDGRIISGRLPLGNCRLYILGLGILVSAKVRSGASVRVRRMRVGELGLWLMLVVGLGVGLM